MKLENLYQKMGIEKKVYVYGQKIEEALKERFAAIDKTAEYNQLKVIDAMQSTGSAIFILQGQADMAIMTLEGIP